MLLLFVVRRDQVAHVRGVGVKRVKIAASVCERGGTHLIFECGVVPFQLAHEDATDPGMILDQGARDLVVAL